MVAPLSGARSSSGAIFRTKLVIIIITWWRHRASSQTHRERKKRGATEAERQVAPSSGQNWLSSSSHGGATAAQGPKKGREKGIQEWRHLRTKLVIIIPTWWRHFVPIFSPFWRHLPDKTGYHHHHHMVAPLSGARYSSGAIFRTKLVIIIMVAPLSGARYSSGAIFRTKLVIIIITWWRH